MQVSLLQAEATSEGTQEYYSNAVSLLNARKTMRSSNAGVSVGIYYVEVGLSGGKESEFLRNISQHRSQVRSYYPVALQVHRRTRSSANARHRNNSIFGVGQKPFITKEKHLSLVRMISSVKNDSPLRQLGVVSTSASQVWGWHFKSELRLSCIAFCMISFLLRFYSASLPDSQNVNNRRLQIVLGCEYVLRVDASLSLWLEFQSLVIL